MKVINKKQFINLFMPVVFLIVLSIIVLFISPYYASNLSITPDSVEYSISAHNFVFEGLCEISYCNEWFPLRYPPWFSLFILAPSFYIFGSEIGNAIIPIFFLGTLGIIFAYLIGYIISNQLGGVLSALILLSLPIYQDYSKLIMTDIPNTTFILGAALVFIKIDAKKKSKVKYLFIAGLLCACSAALRPATYSVILPFLIILLIAKEPLRRKIVNILILLAPGALVVIATAYYNKLTFGSPMRNGYHFWCPIPYDYLDLVFSSSNICRNIRVIFSSWVPFLGIIYLCSFFIREKYAKINFQKGHQSKKLMIFTLISSIPIIFFHLLYFYSELRFFLPVMVLLVIITASELSKWLSPAYIKPKIIFSIMALFLLSIIIYKIFYPNNYAPYKRLVGEEINEVTPGNAIIISSIDPIYLNFITRHSKKNQRVIIPTSRKVEYASKLIAPTPLKKLSPPPQNSFDHRNSRLVDAGAIEVIPLVANENIGEIIELAKQGIPVFIDTSHVTKSDAEIFQNLYFPHFTFHKKSRFVYRLILKNRKLPVIKN